MTPWLILIATLPTSPSGLRVRIWRTLKATHCATLREGVYVLPATAPSAKDFWAMDTSIREAGAESHLLELLARDEAQEAGFRALFDRSARYVDFARSLKEARKTFPTASQAQIRKCLRTLDQQLHGLLAAENFPSAAAESEAAKAGLQALRHEAEQRLSPGEPAAGAVAITRLDIADYQGKTWATRTRPWIDRLASAWLVQRFVDQSPNFLWLQDTGACPPSALGHDFDGAVFSHVGDRTTYEVLAESFGLDTDPALSAWAHSFTPSTSAALRWTRRRASRRSCAASGHSTPTTMPCSGRLQPCLTRSTPPCDSHARANSDNDNSASASASASELGSGLLVLAQTGLHQLRRTGRADSHHA